MPAAEGPRGAPAESSPSSPPSEPVAPPQEEDILRVFRLLGQIGQAGMQPESQAQTGQFGQQMSELPTSAQVTLTQALASLAASPSAKPDTPLLVQLAEHVAIRFALDRYER